MAQTCRENSLSRYYEHLFPCQELFRWLTYGRPDIFKHREFSFTIPPSIYIRYQCYRNASHFKSEILDMIPKKIDIGAIYNCCPKKGIQITPVEKELVFDIDISDYDNSRTCCQNTDICSKCWKFIVFAVKILDSTLREDFGFKHILWVYSGRRGVHCWVSDESARKLSTHERRAIAKYLTILSGGAEAKKKIVLPKEHTHPFIKRSLDIINPNFFSVCIYRQDILNTEERTKRFLGMIPNRKARKDISRIYTKFLSTVDKWDGLSLYLRLNAQRWPGLSRVLEEIALEYCCLRLDIEVTKNKKHLLKAPFSVHPETGNISIPFDPKDVDTFNVEVDVPNVARLCFNHPTENTTESNNDRRNFEKSLKVFNEFLEKLEASNYK